MGVMFDVECAHTLTFLNFHCFEVDSTPKGKIRDKKCRSSQFLLLCLCFSSLRAKGKLCNIFNEIVISRKLLFFQKIGLTLRS